MSNSQIVQMGLFYLGLKDNGNIIIVDLFERYLFSWFFSIITIFHHHIGIHAVVALCFVLFRFVLFCLQPSNISQLFIFQKVERPITQTSIILPHITQRSKIPARTPAPANSPLSAKTSAAAFLDTVVAVAATIWEFESVE